jgi:L-amino acid N-acyltransferase YncA
MTIEELKEAHYPSVKKIYEQGIASGNATFETIVPDWENWDKKFLPRCRLVAIENGEVTGWAALSPVSQRIVYKGVAEVSVYVAETGRGKGTGKALLSKLVTESEGHNIWTLQAGIFPENEASIHIHLLCGFRIVGRRERIGKMKNNWRDTLLLERRSSIAGR